RFRFVLLATVAVVAGVFAAGGPLAGSGRAALRQGEQHLSDSDLVAFGHLHLGDRPGNRRRHFDGGLVGLELDDRLILFDRVTGFDEHREDVASLDALAERGQRDFVGHDRSAVPYMWAGSAVSGLMDRSLKACCATLTSICPARASAESVAATTWRASTSKWSRSASRLSLRP